MEFLYPSLLWLLSLLIIPVLIHLFHFRRHKTLFFPSLKFIKFIEQEKKSSKKLKDLLGEGLAKNYLIVNEKGKYKIKLPMNKVEILLR